MTRFGRGMTHFGRAKTRFGRGMPHFGRAEACFGRDSNKDGCYKTPAIPPSILTDVPVT